MRMAKGFLNAANTIISYIMTLSLCLAGGYALYALWDNNTIYASIDNIQDGLLDLKPTAEEGLPSFEELLIINPDVVGWVTIDNTNMDYPIVQGENNLTYLNTDIYGNFSLGGSIFLDSRNDSDFADSYSLLYGHNINNGKMFGDIILYQDKAFFEENQTGELLTKEAAFTLDIFASLLVPANEEEIFNTTLWQDGSEQLFDYAEETALYLNQDKIDQARLVDGDLKILALSTCSYDFTDARVVILAVMVPSSAE